jgi:hypothetical protein
MRLVLPLGQLLSQLRVLNLLNNCPKGACSNVETNIVTLNIQTGLLTLSGNIATGTIQAYNATQINSVQNMPATTQIEYNVGKTMLLSPCFQASSQSFFRATITGCN